MKCNECLNSRLVISENGYHRVCTLRKEKDMYKCLMGKEVRFTPDTRVENSRGEE